MFENRTSVVRRILGFLRSSRENSKITVDAIQKKTAENQASSSGLSVTTVIAAGVAITALLASLAVQAKSSSDEKGSQLESFKGQMFPGTDLSTPLSNAVQSDVPSPTAGTRRSPEATEEVKQALLSASKVSDTDYTLLYSVAGVESAFKANAKASTSSATGMFQFTTSTWNYLTKTLYPYLNYTLSDRLDPFKAAKVAGLYLNSIKESLSRRLGRIPSHAEIYLGYFLGPSGAGRFLEAMKKNPNGIGAWLFPDAASANPGVFYKSGRALSLREILLGKEDKLAGYAARSAPASTAMASSSAPRGTSSASTPQVASASDMPAIRQRTGQQVAQSGLPDQTIVVPQSKKPVENEFIRGRNGVIYTVPA